MSNEYTPEQIATDAMTGLAPGHPVDPDFVRELIATVIEADRIARPPVSVPEDLALSLPDPKAGCACTPYSQDAGGGYFEHPLEYEPACPIHSAHVYDPIKGEWIDRGTADYGAEVSSRPVPDAEDDREALKVAITDGYWKRTGYRVKWEQIGPLMDAILDAGFSRRPVPSQTPEPTDAQIEAAARAIADEQGVRFGPGMAKLWRRQARAALIAATRVGTTPAGGE